MVWKANGHGHRCRGSCGYLFPPTHLNDRDRILVDATRDNFAWNRSWVGDAGYIRERVSEAGESGTTEIIYNPAVPDPLREIRAFAEAPIG